MAQMVPPTHPRRLRNPLSRTRGLDDDHLIRPGGVPLHGTLSARTLALFLPSRAPLLCFRSALRPLLPASIQGLRINLCVLGRVLWRCTTRQKRVRCRVAAAPPGRHGRGHGSSAEGPRCADTSPPFAHVLTGCLWPPAPLGRCYTPTPQRTSVIPAAFDIYSLRSAQNHRAVLGGTFMRGAWARERFGTRIAGRCVVGR